MRNRRPSSRRSSTKLLVASAFALLAGMLGSSPASADEIITLSYTRPAAAGGAAVTQRYILLRNFDPDLVIPAPTAVLVLFTGGGGKLGLAFGGTGGTVEKINLDNTNFLLRTRHLFASGGRVSPSNPLGRFVVAVPDAASDFLALPNGLRGQRTGPAYRFDMRKLFLDLRAKFPDTPIWVIGTSRGTIAAAQAASDLAVPAKQRPDGVVLTSSLTVPTTGPTTLSLAGVDLENINVPTLVVAHNADQCNATPPGNTIPHVYNRLTGAPIRKVLTFGGGVPRISQDVCDALSYHGFFGVEQNVINAIAGWIKNPVP